MSNWPEILKKIEIKINKRTNQRLKKKIHAERVTVEKFKKKEKKEKKEPENVVGKRKKKWKKKQKRWTIRTLFIFISVTFECGTGACFLLYYFVEIVLLKILLLSSTWGGAAQ